MTFRDMLLRYVSAVRLLHLNKRACKTKGFGQNDLSQLADLCARVHNPDAHCLIPRTLDDSLAVGREGERVNIAGMPLEWITYRLASLHIPDHDCPVAGP